MTKKELDEIKSGAIPADQAVKILADCLEALWAQQAFMDQKLCALIRTKESDA